MTLTSAHDAAQDLSRRYGTAFVVFEPEDACRPGANPGQYSVCREIDIGRHFETWQVIATYEAGAPLMVG